jgi:hypothetical protein
MKRIILVAAMAVALAGCAIPARTGGMVATPTAPAPVSSALHEAVQIGAVTGGKKSAPMGTSQVEAPQLKDALQESLASDGLYGNPGKYRLDANLDSIDQPWIGLDMTVKSTIHYSLIDTATGSAVFDKAITASYTATVGDAIIGAERLRLANEGSIKKNIETFLDQVVEGSAAPRPAAP